MAARLAKLRGAGFVGITGLPADNAREQARFAVAKKFGCDLRSKSETRASKMRS